MPHSNPGSRRERRAARDRQRTRRTVYVVVGGLMALVVGAGALLMSGALDSGDGQDEAAGSVQAAPTSTTFRSGGATSTSAGSHCRALTSADPLRLWVGGDSLAGSLGPSLGNLAGATGVVQPYFDSRVSSGLSNSGFFDWPEQATKEMTRLEPEVVVFIIGTNDYTTPTNDDSWKADYTKKVEAMLAIFETDNAGQSRTVYWVGAPHLKDDKMDEGAAAVNAVAQDVIAKHKGVVYVDAHKLFSDTDGKYAQNLPDETGKLVTMRAGDGVHLTVDGGDYLARAVFKSLDEQCRITAQKVDGQTKQTIQTEGSTQVANGSGSGSGGTVQTTPPYTTPATTSAPATTQATSPPSTTPPTDPPTTAPTTSPTTTPGATGG